MVFKTSYNAALGQPAFNLNGVDTTPRVAIGTILKGYDDVLGEGEFIYLPGVASCAAGDVVVYDLLPGGPTTTRVTAAGQPNSGQLVTVAVVAVPAASYGWFQISGVAIVNVIAATAAGRAFLSATAGQLTSVAAAGVQLVAARLSSAIGTPSATQAYLTLSRAAIQSQIT